MHTTLLVLSALAAVWSYVDLIKDLVKHNKAQPFATRLAVCFALVLNCVGVIAAHGSPGDLVLAVVYATLSLLVVWLSMSRREARRVTTIDMLCLVVSIGGAVAFAKTGHSTAGIACAVAADLVAYLPTIRACWKQPETQPSTTYLIGLAAALFALAADYVHGGIRLSSTFTIYLIMIDAALPAIIRIRKGVFGRTVQEALNEA